MTKLLKLSGAESLSVAGNIFLGQTESPLMIKAYLANMNRSEISIGYDWWYGNTFEGVF